MDLSGSMQGAGGVAGLLAVNELNTQNSTFKTYYPTYDGNGNVSEYLSAAGVVVAHYEYDAFGNTVSSSGTKVADFAHRFSTKYYDEETGLYYYGYRYYDPQTGRWPSRDPIGEHGGINLYGMVGNNSVDLWDFLGLKCFLLLEHSLMRKKGQEAYEQYKRMIDAAKASGYEIKEGATAGNVAKTLSDGECTKIIFMTHGDKDGAILFPHNGLKFFFPPNKVINKENKNKVKVILVCCHWDKVCNEKAIRKAKEDGIELEPLRVPQLIEKGLEGEIQQRDGFRHIAKHIESEQSKKAKNK